MRKMVMLAVAVVFAFALLTGCNMEQLDEDAIRELVLGSEWFDTGSPEDSTRDEPSPTSFFVIADTVVWWRGAQTRDTAVIDIQVDDDSAWVEWTREHTAMLNIFANMEEDTVWYLWNKDINEQTALRATFKNTGAANDYEGWELDKISCAVGNSLDNSVKLDSIHITSPVKENDIMITDPLNKYFDIDEEIIKFASAEKVTITLYTSGADAVAFLHTIVGLWPVRIPFEEIEEGVFQGEWNAQWVEGYYRYAIFDVMTESALYDSEAAYDYSGVLVPYTIEN